MDAKKLEWDTCLSPYAHFVGVRLLKSSNRAPLIAVVLVGAVTATVGVGRKEGGTRKWPLLL